MDNEMKSGGVAGSVGDDENFRLFLSKYNVGEVTEKEFIAYLDNRAPVAQPIAPSGVSNDSIADDGRFKKLLTAWSADCKEKLYMFAAGPLTPYGRLARYIDSLTAPVVNRLAPLPTLGEFGALRQFKHNDGTDGFVTAYDYECTNQYISLLKIQFAQPTADSGDSEVEYELVQDDMCVAGAEGPNALAEIQHYAMMYGQDGPVSIFEVRRRKIVTHSHKPASSEVAK